MSSSVSQVGKASKNVTIAHTNTNGLEDSGQQGPQLMEAEELGSFFGGKALQKQKMIFQGRHPQSLPKDSELWHYSKLSSQRRDRIKKGHQFWDVIDEESVENTLPGTSTGTSPSRSVGRSDSGDLPARRRHSQQQRRDGYDDGNASKNGNSIGVEGVRTSPASTRQVSGNDWEQGGDGGIHSEESERGEEQHGGEEEEEDEDEELGEEGDADYFAGKERAAERAAAAYMAAHAHDPGMDLRFLKSSSINSQLKDFLSGSNAHDLQHLELKVNFKHSRPVYFGMSFIIINYNQEILYVNSRDELRCKAVTRIEPADRIRFKLIDLFNPSNPKALRYGDNCWLQVLDADEAAEASFATGHVLASKLFGVPQLASVQYADPSATATAAAAATARSAALDPLSLGPLTAKLEAAGLGLRARARAQQQSQEQAQQQAGRRVGRRSSTRGSVSAAIAAAAASGRNSISSSPRVGSSGSTGDPLFDAAVGGGGGVRTGVAGDAADNAEDEEGVEEEDDGDGSRAAAKVCGDVQVVRIIETRKTGDVPGGAGAGAAAGVSDGLTDERALRYHSKQASLQGKWAIHSAALRATGTAAASRAGGRGEGGARGSGGASGGRGHGHGGGSGSNRGRGRGYASESADDGTSSGLLQDSTVYSLTPIFIQQDLYCVGTMAGSEHHQWPMRSSGIIDNSPAISREQANTYRAAFRDSVSVKSAVSRFSSQNKGSRATAQHTYDDMHSAGLSGSQMESGVDFGCIRRVVRRGFPYDFSVDRKCVWQLCLFEQFSDNNVKLSDRDKAARRVMETATMAMKLSQLNREGARTHIEASHHHDMPALVGGENFARTLREINHKTSLRSEQRNLQHRRVKELKLAEHFQHHMAEVDAAVLEEEQRVEKRMQEERLHRQQQQRLRQSYLLDSRDAADMMIASAGAAGEGGSQTLSVGSQSQSTRNFYPGSPDKFEGGGGAGVGGDVGSLGGSSVGGSSSALYGLGGGSAYTGSPFLTQTRRGSAHKPTRKRSSFVIDSLPGSSSNQAFYDKALKEAMEAVNLSLGPIDPKAKARAKAAKQKQQRQQQKQQQQQQQQQQQSQQQQVEVEKTKQMALKLPDGGCDDDAIDTTAFGNGAVGTLGPGLGMMSRSASGFIATARTAGSEATHWTHSSGGSGAVESPTKLQVQQLRDRELLEELAKTRHGHGALDPRRLQLDRPQVMHHFDDLSAGEQVVAMHRTFNRIETFAERSMNSKRNSGGALAGSTALRNLKANPSLARKLELLDAEDKRINTALAYKERKKKLLSANADVMDIASAASGLI